MCSVTGTANSDNNDEKNLRRILMECVRSTLKRNSFFHLLWNDVNASLLSRWSHTGYTMYDVCLRWMWKSEEKLKKFVPPNKMNCTSRYAHSLWFLCDYHLCRNVLCHQTLLFLLKTFGSQFVFSAEYLHMQYIYSSCLHCLALNFFVIFLALSFRECKTNEIRNFWNDKR